MLLLYIFFVVVLVNCSYFILFSKFTFLPPPKSEEKVENYPVSVIVCAKNEAENLKINIPLWLQQEYPSFELILINDASTDDTQEVIEFFAQKDSRVHTVTIENNEAFWGNKKYALTLGIKRAINARMIFTDADCRPATRHWIQIMASHFSEEKQLVLGYGAYEKRTGFLNRIIRFETLMTAIQYFSYNKAQMTYMGVGRNLGYTAKLYYDNRGFMSHMQVNSGDDDLFVNEAATTTNTAICYDQSAFTYSLPKKTFKEWILQKRRHITTSKYYKQKHRFYLGVYYIFNLLFWGLSLTTLLVLDWKIPLGLITFRFLMQYIFVGSGAKLLREKNLIPLLPFYDLFLVLVQFCIFISNKISKPVRWK